METLTAPLTTVANEPPAPHNGAAGLPPWRRWRPKQPASWAALQAPADETRLKIMYFLMQQEELNVRTFCRLLVRVSRR